jgi:dTDP-4-amino-4,6-dideoxygalactose transaminase
MDLAAETRALGAELDEAVRRVVASGRYVLGPEVEAFEREFADYCGATHGVGVNSGTDALALALRAAGVGAGDVVATVPNVSAPTAAAIVMAGARPAFVDVEPRSLTMDPAALARLLDLDAGVRAVVPVHLYGHPADMEAISRVARARDVVVVEDACQAHGASVAGRPVGTHADAACFSFYPTKNLGALGDGGMVVTSSDRIAHEVRMLRSYGEESKYVNVRHGVNSRLDEVQAAVLRVKLARLDAWCERRRAIAALYGGLLAGTGLVLPEEMPWARHVYHLYVVRGPERDGTLKRLAARGIGAAVHYPAPLHLQPAYRDLGYGPGDFPVAERACREVLSLPLYPTLDDERVRQVAEALGG